MPSSLFVDCDIFNVFRKDRPTRGGGVCVLIKKSFKMIAVSYTHLTLPTIYSV